MFEEYVPCLVEDDSDKEEFVSPMDVAVTAAYRTLENKIRDVAETKSGRRDTIGILLYGCDPRRGIRAKQQAKKKKNEKSDDNTSPKSADSSDSDEMDELPTTHELIELTPPGIQQVLDMQECMRPLCFRDLRKEFTAPKKGEGKSTGEGTDTEDEDDGDITLRQGLTAAMKIFSNST